MADPNSDLLLLARRLKRVPTPTWLTLQWAEAARVDTPLPQYSRLTPEQWREKCRKQHNKSLRRVASYVASLRSVWLQCASTTVFWAVVWKDPSVPARAGRWRGQLIKEVWLSPGFQWTGPIVDSAASFAGDTYRVTWTGSEIAARTRRDVVEKLRAEALT